ncbi:tetratricopeptide repeat-containing diguanylate cyclase [Actinoplanes sp. TFC3]|uniref:tetratricopeptide repeat-containing diguanylate cyclase n=1 Tax=Actinoplanes sp. TFC3 TaxID=1710355 RepID=UPI0012901A0D|nr:tetratricopeptide repeat-containing diguanylate cyclase [Actinoplanes sp. TFC3]
MSGTSLAESPRSPVTAAAVQVTALLDQAEEARLRGDYRAGSSLARQSAALAASAGDGAGEARALRSMANQLLRLGEQEAAVTACREAVAVLETLQDDPAICEVLTAQAMPLTDLGMHEEALEALARAYEIAQKLGDRTLLYWVHNRTGVVHGSMGDRDRSTACLMKALTIVEGMDDEARFCILNNLGDNAVYQIPLLRADGNHAGARETLDNALTYVDEALQLARDARHPYRESICLDNYGMLRALDGDFESADRMIEDSRAIAVIHGYRSLESAALQHQAHVRLMRGECAKAIEGLLEALVRAADAGETPMMMEIHRELSDAYEQVADFPAALLHYKAFHALERTAHNHVAAARARMAVHRFELDNARLEAELAQVRSAELEVATLAWQRQATEDPLTGLPNRRYAEARLPEMLVSGGSLSVAMADVDLFKGVNDRFGHFVGDEVLRQIAAVLRDNVRDTDLVARMGGEEFMVALDGVDAGEARARCEILRAQVASYPWEGLQPGLRVTISFGLAVVPAAGDLPAAMVLADRRLYEAKRAGRNRVKGD